MTETHAANDYDFDVPTGDIPARPDRLFVPDQLERAVAEHVPDDVDVTVNERFRRTVVRATSVPGARTIAELEVSWEHFEDEEHYGGDGWAVVMSAVNAALSEGI